MRKFIVERFALDYITKVGKYQFNFVRAATFIFPLMVVTGYLHTLAQEPNKVLLYTSWFLLMISLFLGFVYFRVKPVKYEELEDIEQIFQYGSALTSGQISRKAKEMETEAEYVLHGTKYNDAIEALENKMNRKYYKPWRVVFHPLIIVTITAVVIIILEGYVQ